MKKLLTLATAAMLFTSAFAHDGKDCGKGKKCTKEEMANCKASAKKDCCKKDSKVVTAKATKTVKPVVVAKKA
ncbi:MAG TPA: hypothetical protein VF622_04220 [Segetibacter sp.]|jgi:hypothetical protein